MKKFLICLMVGLFLVTSVGIGCKKKEEAKAPETKVTEEAPAPAEHKAPAETKAGYLKGFS